ncbi:hypothetical protein B0A52_03673 [Exophiala mesophila]|uniref:Uncharacterized protein n=1 Tax=Exophiala mesophila TaxID=212818 RepID=A0A438NA36_EXOME|nr:hypothetical protein B0A52_03673 [Exophiala mesophila]
MSTTMYQTNAKPRGRRGSQGELHDKPARSRATSSASLRLSKTLSRALDEVSVPRNSRPGSPAIYLHRNKTIDARVSDTEVGSRSHIVEPQARKRQASVPAAPLSRERELSAATVAGMSLLQSGERQTESARVEIDGNRQEWASQASTNSKASSPPLSTSTTRSFRSVAAMQPTVTEESDEKVEDIPAQEQQDQKSETPALTVDQQPALVPGSFPEEVPVAALYQTPQTNPTTKDPRASESSIDELLLAPAPKASIPLLQPARAGSPWSHLSESGISNHVAPRAPSIARPTTAHPEHFPTGRSPVTSAPGSPFMQHYAPVFAQSPPLPPTQSPIIHQYGPPPPPSTMPYPPPFAYPPPMVGGPVYDPSAGLPMYGPAGFPMYPPEMIPRPVSGDVDEERDRLLEKVSNVLPDINRLLLQYQETQGLLTEKDNLVKQAESQHMEEIGKLKFELSITKEEYDKLLGLQAAENVNLKTLVSEQEKKIEHLMRQVYDIESEKTRAVALEARVQEVEFQLEQSKASAEDANVQRGLVEDKLNTLNEQIANDTAAHERIVAEIKEDYERRLTEAEEAHANATAEHKAALARVQLDLAAMITKHASQNKNLEASRAIITELEGEKAAKDEAIEAATQEHQRELAANQQTIDEIMTRHDQEVALWSEKLARSIVRREDMIQDLKRSFDGRLEKERKDKQAEIAALTEQHENRQRMLQDKLETAQGRSLSVEKELEKERALHTAVKDEFAKSQQGFQQLKTRHDRANRHHMELSQAMQSMRNKQIEWQRESERMDSLLQSLGQVDVDAKGEQGE